MVAVISVVVPAHNEAAVIERGLRSLLGASPRCDLEIVVVCNGCTDATAARARSVDGPIKVVEIEEASKIAALNVADGMLTTFPRVYVDADVEFPAGALVELIQPLIAGECDLALPRSQYIRSGDPLVRSYLRFWSRLPQVVSVSAGSGVYALSREGRARFGSWPDTTNDDAFVRTLIDDSRTSIVEGSVSSVRPPRSVWALTKRKARVAYGNRQVADRSDGVHPWTGWISVVRRHPRMLLDLPIYAVITLLARTLAFPGRKPPWASDATSRESGATGNR